MVLFIGASVNNDTLLMLLSTAALGLMVRDVQSDQPGLRGRQTLLLGVLLGLACLTKVSGALLLPVAALAVTFSAWRARSWQSWLARGLLLLLAVAAIAGWWYLRNLRLYGELTGITTMAAIAGARPAGFGLADLPGEWRSFWYSFWGLFGAFNVLAPAWFYALTGGLALLAGAGLLLRAAACLRGRRLPAHWQSHALLALFIALTFIGIVRWTLITMASQGRLMFGAVAAIALYLALGWLAWFPPRWQRWAGAGMAATLAGAAAILALTAIAPSYRPAQPLAALPADAVALNITCADDITLLGYRLGQETIQPGQPLEITLYWTAQRPVADNLQLSINVYGFGEERIAKLDTWPGGGLLPTRFWQPGAIYPDRYLLPTSPSGQRAHTAEGRDRMEHRPAGRGSQPLALLRRRRPAGGRAVSGCRRAGRRAGRCGRAAAGPIHPATWHPTAGGPDQPSGRPGERGAELGRNAADSRRLHGVSAPVRRRWRAAGPGRRPAARRLLAHLPLAAGRPNHVDAQPASASRSSGRLLPAGSGHVRSGDRPAALCLPSRRQRMARLDGSAAACGARAGAVSP
jgi:hypothetical protein